MKRRHYGIAWNMKKHRLRPNPMPNVGMSRSELNRMVRYLPEWGIRMKRVVDDVALAFAKLVFRTAELKTTPKP